MNQTPYHWCWSAIALLSVLHLQPVKAQIQGDPSSTTQVTQTNPSRYQITGGKRSQGNLFHSFQEFSIPDQQSAKFILKPTDSITHIFARVTGQNRSLINGTLLSDGQAHVILLNPNGITFGQNARFNLGGSFLGTTGQAIQFKNGQRLTPTQNLQLLQVKTPVGIQLGTNPGSIQNLAKRRPNSRLSLPANQHFALVGGSIQFLGGHIVAPNGTVSLAAIGPKQTVQLNPFSSDTLLNVEGVTQFQDLTFNDQAFLRTLSNQPSPTFGPQGAIQLWGKDATLNDLVRFRSSINQDIQLHLKGHFVLDGRSKILSDTTAQIGSGDIDIQAHRLTLKDGSQINASVRGVGTGGNITVQVEDRITLTDISPISRESSAILSDGFEEGTGGNIQITAPLIQLDSGGLIRSQVFRNGQGGQIDITTDQLLLNSGSQISSTASNPNFDGKAGSINITARENTIVQGSLILPVSKRRRLTAIRAESLGSGNAGTLNLTTPVLEILDGAQIINTTRGTAGRSEFQIRDRLLISGIPNNRSSGIFSDSFLEGEAGPIQISAPLIEIKDGGFIRSQVFRGGTGGDITIQSEQIEIQGGSQISNNATRLKAAGQAGNVDIFARDSITITGSIIPPGKTNVRFSKIQAQSRGDAPSGQIRLTTPQLTLENGAQITNSTAGRTRAASQAGNIQLSVNTLALTGNNTGIFSETEGLSPAGNIILQPQTGQTFRIDFADQSQISASSSLDTLGESGTIQIQAPQSILINGEGTIAAESQGSSLGGVIALTSPTIQIVKGSRISSNSTGNAQAGDIKINGDRLLLSEGATLSTSSAQNAGGNIELNLFELVLITDESEITAEAQGLGGNISSLSNPSQRAWLLAPNNNSATLNANSLGDQGGNIDLNQFQVFGFNILNQSPTNPNNQLNLITASGRTPEEAGNINAELVTNLLPNSLPQPPSLIGSQVTQDCRGTAGSQSSFNSIGQGGTATNAFEVGHRSFWEDSRDVAIGRTSSIEAHNLIPKTTPAIQEAQGWHQTSTGQIQLRAFPLSAQALPVAQRACKTLKQQTG